MSNCCETCYIFYSENKESLSGFFNDLKGIFLRDSECWLRNVAKFYEIKPDTICCNGYVAYCDGIFRENDKLYYFELNTYTAYEPVYDMWAKILEKYCDINFCFEGVEPLEDLYVVYDVSEKFFHSKYYIKTDDDYMICCSDNELLHEVNCILNLPFKNLDEMYNYLKNHDVDIEIHEFKQVKK